MLIRDGDDLYPLLMQDLGYTDIIGDVETWLIEVAALFT
ncbi:MAG: hypothetical protein ACI8S6_001027 [Myxococcota bacterium]|jgi:hypothetical protein